MKSKRAKLAWVLVLTLIMSLFLASCQDSSSSSAENSGPVRPDALVIASGNSAGTYYYIATGQSQILSEKVEGLTVTNEATNGSINYDLASENVDTIGMGGLEQFVTAYNGNADRGWPEPLDNLGLIQVGHKYILYAVTLADSGIETMADLNGKKIGMPSKAGTANPMIEMLYEAYGIDKSTVSEQVSTHSENLESLKDGVIDVAFVAGGVPMAGLTDLATSKDIKLLDIDPEVVAPYMEMEENAFFDLQTIEPGTYNGQNDPVNLMTVSVVLAANLDLDEDLVYEITKVLNESTDELAVVHKDGAEWNLENSLAVYEQGIANFHPGAARYYDEQLGQ